MSDELRICRAHNGWNVEQRTDGGWFRVAWFLVEYDAHRWVQDRSPVQA